MTRRRIAVNSRKYNGVIRRSWGADLVKYDPPLIELVGTFDLSVDHPDLGHIAKGTVSHESYWLDRWYNIFDFENPDGSKRNHYINIGLPPRFDDESVDYIDLDIDLIIWPSGQIDLLDIDDFRSNAELYSYPNSLVQTVNKKLDMIMKAVRSCSLSRLYSEDVAAD
jgi:protein associated with RNAse G/E